jgi:phosphohistidine phosphatase
MRTVHLLRHAKSDWNDEAIEDRERPLAPRGIKAARQLAQHLKKADFEVDLVLSSPARRTRETVELIRPALGKAEISFEKDLYGASAEELLKRLRRLPRKVAAVLIVGHNPGIEIVASLLLPEDAGLGRFPTGALASLRFPGNDWKSIQEGGAEAIGFITPKEL